jgi:gamma-glutamyltranspeptidase / glutathione hydrolase
LSDEYLRPADTCQLRTISLADALAPAIRVARDGFVGDQTFFDQTRDNVDYFNDIPATAALASPGL